MSNRPNKVLKFHGSNTFFLSPTAYVHSIDRQPRNPLIYCTSAQPIAKCFGSYFTFCTYNAGLHCTRFCCTVISQQQFRIGKFYV